MDTVAIDKMTQGGAILGEVLGEVLDFVRPGISELELDRLAEKLIVQKGGKPGFKKVPGYHHTICTSVNNVVVHGIPTNRIIKEGDIVGIDCGVYFGGYHTDMAETLRVSTQNSTRQPAGKTQNSDIEKFLEVGKRAMFAGIKQAKAGNHVGHISHAIQNIVESAGYSVVRSLVGHGVGRQLHEAPEIPGYLSTSIEQTPILKTGMTIAIEVIYNMGGPDVAYSNEDDWTIITRDGNLSGLFERTILIAEKDPKLLTQLETDRLAL